MAKRITSSDESINEDQDEELQPSKPRKGQPDPKCLPKGYVNPFDDPEQDADGYPYVFTDIDFEIKQAPHKFDGFENEKVNLHSESKSENERIWQYTRWKTWIYLEEQEKVTVVMQRADNDKETERGTVQINAVTYYILKGVEVYVPKDVKEMILTSQNQTSMAGRQNLVTSLARKLDPVTGLPKDPTRLER